MFWYIYAYLISVLATMIVLDRTEEITTGKAFMSALIVSLLFGWILLPAVLVAKIAYWDDK